VSSEAFPLVSQAARSNFVRVSTLVGTTDPWEAVLMDVAAGVLADIAKAERTRTLSRDHPMLAMLAAVGGM